MLLSSLLFTLFVIILCIIGYISYIGLNSTIEKIMMVILSILILVFNTYLVFFFYCYLGDYFIQILPIGKIWITINFFLFLWWISFLSIFCFPADFVNTRSLVGTLHFCVSFLFNGVTFNIFKFNDDNTKTILNNSGGSPKLTWAWSDLPLTRFARFQIVAAFFVSIELIYGNILNETHYIPLNRNESIRYTYGLVLLVLVLILIIIIFSCSGNRVQRLSSLWFTMGLFHPLLGEKIPGSLAKNIFTNLSTSSLIDKPKPNSSKEETNSPIVLFDTILFGRIKEKQYELRILPVHVFFLAIGRMLQVSCFILLSVFSLLFFVVFIILCFCLILNYIDASQFGDGAISFFQVLKSLSHNSVNFSLDALRSKIIVDTPTEWIFQKIDTVSDVNWEVEVSKVNTNSLSSADIDSNQFIGKEMPADVKRKFYLVIGIFFVVALLTSMTTNVTAG